MGLIRIIEPDVEPVTLAEAKAFCRVTHDEEDAIIAGLIVAAREMAQNELARSLITQTWQLTLDQFPVAIQLVYPRVGAISSVRFVNPDGDAQTLNSACYQLDGESEPAWLVPADGYAWPDTDDRLNAVVVTYTAGYGDTAAEVPEPIKTWIKLQAAHFFANREAAGGALQPLPFVGGLLDPYRVVTLP
jgi:uncharacterized phiE125 gp8 family phage protein